MTGERKTKETVSLRCSGEATELLGNNPASSGKPVEDAGNNPAAFYKKKNFMSDVQSAKFSLSLTLSSYREKKIVQYQEDNLCSLNICLIHMILVTEFKLYLIIKTG